jgi:hypothetical protein
MDPKSQSPASFVRTAPNRDAGGPFGESLSNDAGQARGPMVPPHRNSRGWTGSRSPEPEARYGCNFGVRMAGRPAVLSQIKHHQKSCVNPPVCAPHLRPCSSSFGPVFGDLARHFPAVFSLGVDGAPALLPWRSDTVRQAAVSGSGITRRDDVHLPGCRAWGRWLLETDALGGCVEPSRMKGHERGPEMLRHDSGELPQDR